MESGGFGVESGHLGISDLDALRIVTFIEATGNGESGLCGGAGDQLDDDQVADQWLAAPVLSDEGKQPMLYLVLLAGAQRHFVWTAPRMQEDKVRNLTGGSIAIMCPAFVGAAPWPLAQMGSAIQSQTRMRL